MRPTLALFQNFPNPFNPSTVIPYSVPGKSRVTLRVYSVGGHLVRTLFDGSRQAGSWSARWDGTDDAGTPVASGMYFYRLRVSNVTTSKKMLLLK